MLAAFIEKKLRGRLRSLYFVLAGAIGFFRYLKIGLSVVLVFIGVKMLLGIWDIHIAPGISLAIVLGIILVSMGASIIAARREGKHLPDDDEPPAPTQDTDASKL